MFKRNPPAKFKSRGGGTHIDYPLLLVVLFLSLFGALMVYSSSTVVAVKQGFEPYHYFIRQLLWILLGLIAGYVVFRIDYHFLAKLATPALLVTLVLMVMVLIIDRDQEIKRWIDIGPFDLQPSELLKFTFILFLSSWLSKHREKRKTNKAEIEHHILYELLPFLILMAVVCGLIVVQPDLDTTVMLGMTAFIVYFLSGSDMIHLVGSLVTGAVSGIAVLIMTLSAGYRMERLTTYLEFWKNNSVPDPFRSGFQLRQILIAVASGGFFGVGFGESTQKYFYLGNTAFTDSIFAVFSEEFGLGGSIILISLFVYLLLKGYKIAMNAPDKLGFCLAIGISTWLTLQAFFHIASHVVLTPINGNTLTFISYGGSSTIVNLMAVGLLLNVARFSGTKTVSREGETRKGLVISSRRNLRLK